MNNLSDILNQLKEYCPNKITYLKNKKIISDHINNKRTNTIYLTIPNDRLTLTYRKDIQLYFLYLIKDSGIIYQPYMNSLTTNTSSINIQVNSRYSI